jgi:hypothetical protein
MKESIIQQQICEYLSIRGIFFFSIPNEHYNISHRQLMTLKKMGLVSGMPDLCILHGGRVYFLEVKNETGTLSDNQKNIHAILSDKGYPVSIVRSVENVESALRLWGILKS